MPDIIQSTTQQFLDIYDITNNFVIMKDGTVSTILTVDAMNFGLLAEEEQDAIMYAYAGLLNSLNYTVQIIIHSQTKDVTSYLKVLQEQELEAQNETLRRRIRMYREFVGNLIHERNVLDKKFYVVIPATALEMGFLATSSILPGSKAFDIGSVERSVIIEKAQNLLDPKRDHLIAQFARIGLFSRQLTTQEIIQLFYIRYNPEAIEGQQIGESNSYTAPLVKASIQENFMNSPQTIPTPIQPAPAVAGAEPITTTQPVSAAQVQPLPEIHIATPTLEGVANTLTETPVDTLQGGASSSEQVPPMSSVAGDNSMATTPLVHAVQTPTEVYTAPTPAPQPVQVTAVPPMTPIEMPPQPTATPITATSTPEIPLEQNIQADINSAVQALGTTTPAVASAPTPAPQPTQPLADLPPLPEI